MPVLDMIECAMVKHRIPNGLPTRLVYRSIYVCFTAFLACTIPFFGGETAIPACLPSTLQTEVVCLDTCMLLHVHVDGSCQMYRPCIVSIAYGHMVGDASTALGQCT